MIKIKEITGQTRVCGLIGDPVVHSVSPAMQNAAFHTSGLDFVYLSFRVKPGDLKKSIEGMRAMNIHGLNVTMPHKVSVTEYLDELDTLAEKIGAVNTIVNHDGKLKGYNTDAAGSIHALKANGIKTEGKRVVLLGAGGAARAIAFALADSKAKVTILNRKKELNWAIELAARVGRAYQIELPVLELNKKNLEKVLAGADILVNATSVGMSPFTDGSPTAADLLPPGLAVFDIVYNPVETMLLKEAKQAGAHIISGLDMLVGQGAVSFELWTGEKAPVEIMKKAAIKALG